MIKITCTEKEKERLIELFYLSDYRIFPDCLYCPHLDCKTCFETDIKWKITKENK